MSEWDNIPWEYSRSGKTRTAVVNEMTLQIAKQRVTPFDPWHWQGKPYVWGVFTKQTPSTGGFGREATLEAATAALIADAKRTMARIAAELEAERKADADLCNDASKRHRKGQPKRDCPRCLHLKYRRYSREFRERAKAATALGTP